MTVRSYFVLVLLLALGCTKDGGIVLPKRVAEAVSDRVVRTSTSLWTTFTCQPAGISFSGPKSARVECSRDSGVIIGMHEVRPAAGVLDDVTYGLYITMERQVSGVSLEDEPAESGDGEVESATEWMTSAHSKLEKLTRGSYIYYRVDLPCSSGRHIRVAARLRTGVSNNSPNFVAEDDHTTRRVMTSVRCLP